jgi:hypothetical protein
MIFNSMPQMVVMPSDIGFVIIASGKAATAC